MKLYTPYTHSRFMVPWLVENCGKLVNATPNVMWCGKGWELTRSEERLEDDRVYRFIPYWDVRIDDPEMATLFKLKFS